MIIEPRHAHSYDTVVYRVHNSNNNVPGSDILDYDKYTRCTR